MDYGRKTDKNLQKIRLPLWRCIKTWRISSYDQRSVLCWLWPSWIRAGLGIFLIALTKTQQTELKLQKQISWGDTCWGGGRVAASYLLLVVAVLLKWPDLKAQRESTALAGKRPRRVGATSGASRAQAFFFFKFCWSGPLVLSWNMMTALDLCIDPKSALLNWEVMEK